jgi:hypothetical protein
MGVQKLLTRSEQLVISFLTEGRLVRLFIMPIVADFSVYNRNAEYAILATTYRVILATFWNRKEHNIQPIVKYWYQQGKVQNIF